MSLNFSVNQQNAHVQKVLEYQVRNNVNWVYVGREDQSMPCILIILRWKLMLFNVNC